MTCKNLLYNVYDMRKFASNTIGTYIDIGANMGSESMICRILHPKARILAFEPCADTYSTLRLQTRYWSIEAYQVALGPGTPMYFERRSHNGLNRFATKPNGSYTVPSMTLTQMFNNYKIDCAKPYIIKSDCECGERFIFEESEAVAIIRGCVQLNMEVHWGEWVNPNMVSPWFKQFLDTHDLLEGGWIDKDGPTRRWEYTRITECVKRGQYATYQLVSRRV